MTFSGMRKSKIKFTYGNESFQTIEIFRKADESSMICQTHASPFSDVFYRLPRRSRTSSSQVSSLSSIVILSSFTGHSGQVLTRPESTSPAADSLTSNVSSSSLSPSFRLSSFLLTRLPYNNRRIKSTDIRDNVQLHSQRFVQSSAGHQPNKNEV
jgi:hypothetical protein